MFFTEEMKNLTLVSFEAILIDIFVPLRWAFRGNEEMLTVAVAKVLCAPQGTPQGSCRSAPDFLQEAVPSGTFI